MKLTGDFLLFSIIIISAILCYLPLILHLELQSNYTFDYHSPLFVHSTIASLAVAFPLSIDVIFNRDLPFNMICSRWILLSSVIFPNLIIYFALDCFPSLKLYVHTIVICNTRVRQIMCNGGLLTIYDSSVPYQQKFRLGALVFGVISNFCQTLIPFYGFIPILRLVQGICSIGTLLGLTFSCVLYFYHMSLRKGNLTFLEKYCMLQSFMIVANLTSKFICVMLFYPEDRIFYSVATTTFFLFSDMITAVIAFMAPTRMAIEEASIAKVMYKAQKNFVRYISHEVRTPLNTLSVGLDLLSSHDIFKISLSKKLKKRDSTNSFSVHGTPEKDINLSKEVSDDLAKQAEDALDILASMKQSCESAICTLNDILLYDKIEAGTMALEKRPISAIQLLSQTIKPFYLQARSHDIQLNLSQASFQSLDGCILEIDINKISQVIRNFLSNSLKFTPSRGTVTLRAYRTEWKDKPKNGNIFNKTTIAPDPDVIEQSPEIPNGTVLRIEVEDSGPGLSLEHQKKLFYQTVQFNAADMQAGNGSGFGLYISRTILDHHDGRIGVTSKIGVGSIFYFEIKLHSYPIIPNIQVDEELGYANLPPSIMLNKVSHSDSVTECQTSNLLFLNHKVNDLTNNECSVSEKIINQNNNNLTNTSPNAYKSASFELNALSNDDDKLQQNFSVLFPNLRFERALIVDDSKLNRKMLSRQLKNYFIDIVEAEDGLEGVQSVEDSIEARKPFNVIFMDNVMPRMTGPNATRMIRTKCCYNGMIVALTGSLLDDDVEEFKLSGITSLIAKPIQQIDIERIIMDLQTTSIQ